MRTQEEHGHTQAEDRGLRRKQTCWHLDFRLLVSRSVRKKFCFFSHPIYGVLLWCPSRLRQLAFLKTLKLSIILSLSQVFSVDIIVTCGFHYNFHQESQYFGLIIFYSSSILTALHSLISILSNKTQLNQTWFQTIQMVFINSASLKAYTPC